MNQDRKILFFDIDGTLITDDGRRFLPDSARYALETARKKGHLVFINTGRVFCNVTEAIRSIGFDGYVCGCGTHIVYNDKVLFHNALTSRLCGDVAAKCHEYGMYAFYEQADKVFLDNSVLSYEPLAKLVAFFKDSGCEIVTDIYNEKFVFDKFCAWYDEGNAHLEEFKAFLSKDFEYIQREGTFCEVVPKGYSKATGIQFLLDYFHIPLENAYAFGDGANDEPMLSYVPNSIIMRKGPDYLKKMVKLVTDDVEDNGIYNAMKKMEII